MLSDRPRGTQGPAAPGHVRAARVHVRCQPQLKCAHTRAHARELPVPDARPWRGSQVAHPPRRASGARCAADHERLRRGAVPSRRLCVRSVGQRGATPRGALVDMSRVSAGLRRPLTSRCGERYTGAYMMLDARCTYEYNHLIGSLQVTSRARGWVRTRGCGCGAETRPARHRFASSRPPPQAGHRPSPPSVGR